MTLPEPSPGDGRILQAIWDMASATSCWPMYAEIVRHFSHEGDTDLEDLLSRLTDGGFVAGFTSPLRDCSIIGLTVAGATACHDAEEVLWAFLAIAKAAAEQAPDLFLTSVMTFEAACGGSVAPVKVPKSEFIFTPDVWTAAVSQVAGHVPEARRQAEAVLVGPQRSRLLPLVVLLLKSEDVGLEDFSGPDVDGRWSASFHAVLLGSFAWGMRRELFSRDFRINFAQDVRDLDDYLSWKPDRKRLATFEPTEGEKRKALLISNPVLLVDVLLEWIYISAAGDVATAVACERFRPDIDPLIINDALHQLKSEERIVLTGADSTRALPHVLLTENGAALVQKSLHAWNNRVFRDHAARNALLAFVYGVAGTAGRVPTRDFLSSPLSAMDGHFFSGGDVAAASQYLQDKGLIHVNGSITRLTSRGYDCIEQGGDVAEYISRKEHVTYNFGNITGNVSTGANAQQVANITQGVDVGQLRTLMDAILQALPTLALEMQDREAAQGVADQVIFEVQQSRPDRSRLARAMRRLRGILASSAQQALAAVLTGAIDNELSRLGLPPGRP